MQFTARGQKMTFPVTYPAAFSRYRLNIRSPNDWANADAIQLSEIELIGLPSGGALTPPPAPPGGPG